MMKNIVQKSATFERHMEIDPLIIKEPVKSMTFSTFIEGESNRLARSMALAVSERPGVGINPLYIYGARGVGKTHLLNAIAVEHKLKGLKLLLGRMEPETGDIDLSTFRQNSILLDDLRADISYDTGALDYCVKKGIQVVMTGSSPPEKLCDLQLSALILHTGKAADIQLPAEELGVAILKARAEFEGISLPDDAAIFIAKNIRGNVRTLIGALERVKAMSSLAGQEISRFSAIQALRDYLWFEDSGAIG